MGNTSSNEMYVTTNDNGKYQGFANETKEYIIDTNNVLPDSDILLFDFWVFLTNKKENIKVNEQMFQKVIDFGSIEDESENIKFSFLDQIIIDKQKYEDGLKIFISLN